VTVVELLLKLIMANAVVNVKTIKSDTVEDNELRSTAFFIVSISEGSGAVVTNNRVM
jgi:hypothetical protein